MVPERCGLTRNVSSETREEIYRVLSISIVVVNAKHLIQSLLLAFTWHGGGGWSHWRGNIDSADWEGGRRELHDIFNSPPGLVFHYWSGSLIKSKYVNDLEKFSLSAMFPDKLMITEMLISYLHDKEARWQGNVLNNIWRN